MELFEARDPLGNRIVLTAERWNHVTKHKVGNPEQLRRCVRQPEEIRQSTQDAEIYLYYRPTGTRHLCVVAHIREGFITTAYKTSYRKDGDTIWSQNG